MGTTDEDFTTDLPITISRTGKQYLPLQIQLGDKKIGARYVEVNPWGRNKLQVFYGTYEEVTDVKYTR